MTTTQEQFLNDIKTQINQYVYRSIERSNDDLLAFLQYISSNNNLNWHETAAKEKLASVFTALAASIQNYSLADGDFRTYCLLQLVAIVCSVYETELFRLYLSNGYNVMPESVIGSLSDAYSTQLPQNTNFPDKTNTSNDFDPTPTGVTLVPKSLYGADNFE